MHYDLFMMLDIYSRYCPGWMVVDQEDGQVTKAWITEVVRSQHIEPATLTIHRPGQVDDLQSGRRAAG